MRNYLVGMLACLSVMASNANAGVITVLGDAADPSVPDLAVGSTVLSITGIFTDDEAINFNQQFLAGPIAAGADIDIGIIDADGTPAGFDNLVLSILSSAGAFSFQITQDVLSGAGAQIVFDAVAALTPGELFTIAITEFAINPGTSTAFFSFNFSAVETSEIPLPAAGPILLAGLAGLSFASRVGRKRAINSL